MNNPYYYPENLGLEMLSFDEPEMEYEYNTLCFWRTKDGRVFSASDSGCSCPTPFEDYEGKTQEEVLQKLERIGSVEQGLAVFDSWHPESISVTEKQRLKEWLIDSGLKA